VESARDSFFAMPERNFVVLQPTPLTKQRWSVENSCKSYQTHFYTLVRDRSLDEFLHTFMIKIEWMLNNRPLTPVSEDADDLLDLTPMSRMTGCMDLGLPPEMIVKAHGLPSFLALCSVLADLFWKRWIKEYLPILQQHQKLLLCERNICWRHGIYIHHQNKAWHLAQGHSDRSLSRRRQCCALHEHTNLQFYISTRCEEVVSVGSV